MKEENLLMMVLIVAIIVAVFQALQIVTLNAQITTVYAAAYQGLSQPSQSSGQIAQQTTGQPASGLGGC